MARDLAEVASGSHGTNSQPIDTKPIAKKKTRNSRDAAAIKRRCVSTACIACRRRKSKCDGNTPSCAACSSVYGTECIYDPGSDHRRKGVYKDKTDDFKGGESTLQTIIQAILNYDEEEVPALVAQIRNCENLDDIADSIKRKERGTEKEEKHELGNNQADVHVDAQVPTFEKEISAKMGELRLENGSVRFIGGTSNLIYLTPEVDENDGPPTADPQQPEQEALLTWTNVTQNPQVVIHLLNMYLVWHYPYFTTLSKHLFLGDFSLGKPSTVPKRTMYCSSLLVNAMLALGCHFSDLPFACADPTDSITKGDHFFAEAKRLIIENDEYEKPRLTTVQALALMSVREAGCGREAKGWVYSGMAFRMALDMGLNLDISNRENQAMDEKEIDARRVTFWGCFLFDKCWSNYLGRLPQLPTSLMTVPKIDVFPDEDADVWSPFTDQGLSAMHAQSARTRAVARQISALCEISSDLLMMFYHPQRLERPMAKGAELKKLGDLHTRLEAWNKNLPKEFEAKDGQLPNVLLMHMFYHLLYIHLFRPFLKYSPSTSPLPPNVSPRKLCTAAAAQISKIMRIYKRTYGLRQICNIAVYIVHSACTIHLLNLPLTNASIDTSVDGTKVGSEGVGKAARRDIVHGVKQLEEVAEDWLCARRTLSILSVLARKWKIVLPEEARLVLERTDSRFGTFSTGDVPSPVQTQLTGANNSQRTSASPRNIDFNSVAGVVDHGYGTTNMAEMMQMNSMATANPISMHTPQPPSPFTMDNFSFYGKEQNQYSPSRYANSPARLSPQTINRQQQVPLTKKQPQPQPQHRPPLYRPVTATSISGVSHPSAVFQPPPGFHPVHTSQPLSRPHHSNSSTPLSQTQQLSPSTMFGHISALENSQDWWLRDQAALAAGFENWTPAIDGDLGAQRPAAGGYFVQDGGSGEEIRP